MCAELMTFTSYRLTVSQLPQRGGLILFLYFLRIPIPIYILIYVYPTLITMRLDTSIAH